MQKKQLYFLCRYKCCEYEANFKCFYDRYKCIQTFNFKTVYKVKCSNQFCRRLDVRTSTLYNNNNFFVLNAIQETNCICCLKNVSEFVFVVFIGENLMEIGAFDGAAEMWGILSEILDRSLLPSAVILFFRSKLLTRLAYLLKLNR